MANSQSQFDHTNRVAIRGKFVDNAVVRKCTVDRELGAHNGRFRASIGLAGMGCVKVATLYTIEAVLGVHCMETLEHEPVGK